MHANLTYNVYDKGLVKEHVALWVCHGEVGH